VHHSFLVANYGADGGCLDNDDGSSYYLIHDNACIYGGHKGDFDSHSIHSYQNLHIYPQVYGERCVFIGSQLLPGATSHTTYVEGFADMYTNNTCVLDPRANIAFVDESNNHPFPNVTEFQARLLLANNTIYCPGAECGFVGAGGFKTYQEFQAAGYDTTTQIVNATPSVDTMIAWARDLLFP
jgi:hypothetical protein